MEPIVFMVFQFPTRTVRPARAGRRALHGMTRAGARALRQGVEAWMVRRYIRQLESLDDRTLADFGVSRCEIEPRVRWHMMREW
jgi:uncharacterized protein YjiS (DUF1127 family)